MTHDQGMDGSAADPRDAASAPGRLPGVGDRVRQYEILGEVGRGGMGVVLHAFDRHLKRDVALKTLLPEVAGDDHARRRFVREARAASRLSHPNIVPVFEAFEDDDLPWLVMPYMEGKSLREVLDGGRVLPIEHVLRLGEDLAMALQAAHDHSVVHRDLKPGNVLLTGEGRALLVDFGLARILPADGHDSLVSTLTGKGAAVGTPAFMSPEQVLGQKLDGRSDLFSLGGLLYRAATGQSPFSSGSMAQVFGAILNRDPDPMWRANRDIPEELERIVRKALAKRPDERYQSAAGLLADLRALRRRYESGSGSGSVPSAVRARPRRWRWLVLAGAVLLGVAAGIVVMIDRSSESFSEAVPRRLTGATGWENQPALSPDGTAVAYVSNESGNPDVWIVDAQGGQPLQLTREPGDDIEPGWFPDSSKLVFTSTRNGRSAVWTIGRFGGEPELAIPNASSAAISPDGRRVAFCRRSGNQTRIFVAPMGELDRAEQLTEPEHGYLNHLEPAWSPDGGSIVYSDADSLWRIDLTTRQVRQLTDDAGRDRHPSFSADGRWVMFSSDRHAVNAIWTVRSDGGAPLRITHGTGPETDPSCSMVASRLAYTTYALQIDVVVVDRETGERYQLGDLTDDTQPTIAPDNSAVVFSSDRWREGDLWLQQLEDLRPSGAPRRLTAQPGSENLPVFSPDGQWLAFHRNVDGQRDVEIVALTGGRPYKFTADPAADVNPDWSPDGSQIVFASDRAGPFNLYLSMVQNGRRGSADLIRLTAEQGDDYFPKWSPDGGQLAFVRADDLGTDVWILDMTESTTRRLTDGADARYLAWQPWTGLLVVSGRWGGGPLRLREIEPASGESRPFAIPGGSEDIFLFSFSEDGRLMAYDDEQPTGDLWLLDNDNGRD